MFLCRDCCKKFTVNYDDGVGEATTFYDNGFFKSRGGCEICGVLSVCADIKSSRLNRKE